MKRQHRNQKIHRELKLINQNLNSIIQNQNEIYLKLEELCCAVKASSSGSNMEVGDNRT